MSSCWSCMDPDLKNHVNPGLLSTMQNNGALNLPSTSFIGQHQLNQPQIDSQAILAQIQQLVRITTMSYTILPFLIDLSTARPPVLVCMIYTSLAWILIIISKPYRSNIILLTNYWTREICIGMIDKWIQLMDRQSWSVKTPFWAGCW